MLKINLFKKYIYPSVVFVGAVVGVGFLSLPYVAMKAGIWVSAFYFIAVTFVVVAMNLIFAEISLKTPDHKRFAGFAKYHLGKQGEIVAFLCSAVGSVGAMLAYLVVGGNFLGEIFGGNNLVFTLVYFTAGCVIIYLGIKILAKTELFVLGLLILSLLFVFLQSFSRINLDNIFIQNSKFEIENLFLPYGPLLFALWSTGMIPEIEEMLSKNKKNLKKILLFCTILISVFYFIFTLFILGISGRNTTESAFAGLDYFLSRELVVVLLFSGVLATFTAFVMSGTILREMLEYDFGIKKWHAFVIACFTPFVLFLMGLKSFIAIVSLFGAVVVGASGIIILLMYKKIGGKKIIIYPLSAVFILGAVYELIYFISR